MRQVRIISVCGRCALLFPIFSRNLRHVRIIPIPFKKFATGAHYSNPFPISGRCALFQSVQVSFKFSAPQYSNPFKFVSKLRQVRIIPILFKSVFSLWQVRIIPILFKSVFCLRQVRIIPILIKSVFCL